MACQHCGADPCEESGVNQANIAGSAIDAGLVEDGGGTMQGDGWETRRLFDWRCA